MNLKHATLVILFSVSAHAMDFEIKKRETGRVVDYSIHESNAPHLSLHYCVACGERSALKCSGCKGVYYCGAQHQKANWKQHKKDCAKIALAHKGNLQQLNNFFRASLHAAQKESSEEAVLECWSWYAKLRVRLTQDVACSTDSSTRTAVSRIAFESLPLIQQLSANLDKKKLDVTNTQAIDWAEQLTQADELVSPEGIRRYGMAIFLEQFGGPSKNDLLDEAAWKEVRLKALEEMKKHLE